MERCSKESIGRRGRKFSQQKVERSFPGGAVVKNPPTNAGDTDTGLIPGSRRSPGKGMAIHSGILAWKIPRKRSLVGYSPWHCKESDVTEPCWLKSMASQRVRCD